MTGGYPIPHNPHPNQMDDDERLALVYDQMAIAVPSETIKSRMFRVIARAAPHCTLWVYDHYDRSYYFRFNPRWRITCGAVMMAKYG